MYSVVSELRPKMFYNIDSSFNGSFAEDRDQPFNSSRKVLHRMLDHKYSSRSFAVIGALAGIVFILLIMALTTCIRHRRDLYASDDPAGHEHGYTREILINHIRQFRPGAAADRRVAATPIDPPPSYDDVVKGAPDPRPPPSPPPEAQESILSN
jgi:hypothetical protein